MENPELMAGIPLLLLGGLGLLIAFSLLAAPVETAEGPRAVAHPGAHPQPAEYVVIGIILAFITAFEVALFYVDVNHAFLAVMLILLSAAKFLLVVGFFMHLRFDSRLFSTMFFAGLILAFSVFIVVMATLRAGLY
jgi:cytochrome c oxidase subunit 4